MNLFNPDCYITVKNNNGALTLDNTDAINRFRDCSIRLVTNDEQNPTNSDVTILNLNRKERDFIVNGSIITVHFGYEGDLNAIYTGDITKVLHKPKSNGWESKLIISESRLLYNDSSFSKTFSKGTTALSIVKALIKTFELDSNVGNFKDELNVKLLRSRTLDGLTKDCLSNLLLEYGLKFSIDTIVRIRDDSKDQENTNDDGIQRIHHSTGALSVIAAESGYNVVILANPQLSIGDTVKLDSDITKGKFIIQAMVMRGSNTGDFTMELTLI